MGDDCMFAHGQAELREPVHQPRQDRGNPSRRGMPRGGMN